MAHRRAALDFVIPVGAARDVLKIVLIHPLPVLAICPLPSLLPVKYVQ